MNAAERQATARFPHGEILHLEGVSRWRLLAAALLSCVVLYSGVAIAQEERPQITPGERKVPRKKEAGPRALAVLQLGADGKTSLVPIAVLMGGKFWDATAYKADPVPMALESGNVYEAERSGSSQGLFTVNSALHSNAANAPAPWIATGSWLPTRTEKAEPGKKAEAAPVGIDTSDAPPRLTRTPASTTPPPNTTPAAPATVPASPPPTPAPSSGDEPPRLSKPAPSNPPSTPAPAETPAATPQADDKGSSGSKVAVPKSDSGASQEERPTLRREPVQAVAEQEVPGYSKPGAKPSKSADNSAPAATFASVQLIPAISDAEGPAPRSYAFDWIKGEEGDRHKQMLDLAKQQLRFYLEAQAKARSGPAPSSQTPTRRSSAKKAPEPILENVKMVAYDLWTTNQPVLILSADGHLPAPPPGAPGGVEAGLQYSIMLAAYPDIYNNLHKLYAGVTDKYHLDLTPRLELIDAVDADGDGRGELLFRETSDAGTGWVVYRATADKLWKMFDSLNPD